MPQPTFASVWPATLASAFEDASVRADASVPEVVSAPEVASELAVASVPDGASVVEVTSAVEVASELTVASVPELPSNPGLRPPLSTVFEPFDDVAHAASVDRSAIAANFKASRIRNQALQR